MGHHGVPFVWVHISMGTHYGPSWGTIHIESYLMVSLVLDFAYVLFVFSERCSLSKHLGWL